MATAAADAESLQKRYTEAVKQLTELRKGEPLDGYPSSSGVLFQSYGEKHTQTFDRLWGTTTTFPGCGYTGEIGSRISGPGTRVQLVLPLF